MWSVRSPQRSPGPALKGGNGEEGEHGLADIIKVELVLLPGALLHLWVAEVPILVVNEVASVEHHHKQL